MTDTSTTRRPLFLEVSRESTPPPALNTAFASLVRHHFATVVHPLPDAAPGIAWIVAENGVFKRGVNADLDILIAIRRRSMAIPGLVPLLPHVRWRSWDRRIPASLLAALLGDARRAMSAGTIARPIEKQYFFVWRDNDLRLIAPRGQDASATRVQYAMPERGAVLVDLHSHHAMGAFFSPTDDADDLGLSVSAVIGQLYTRPEIAVRLNVFGHRMRVPARLIFDDLGPFDDTYGDAHADA